jgi:hypothetical protein
MTITRVIYDGVEFFTINLTGESGMSESGLALLCNVHQTTIHNLLARNSVNTARCAEWLKPFQDKGFHLILRGENNDHIVRSDVCAAVIEYYAFESRSKKAKAKALFSFRKFAKLGIERWIQDITGWQAPEPAEPTIAQRKKIDPQYWDVQLDRHTIYDRLINTEITAPMYRAYLYFLDCDLTGQRPTADEICQNARIGTRNLYDMVEKMRPLTLVPNWLTLDPKSRSIEAQVRDKLQAKVGGIAEASCIYGPIDLLTDTEIIEVKRIDDWKTGLGQVVAKGLEYPDHQRHLYLFGQSKGALRNAKATGKALNITVSFESVNLTTR